MRLFDYLSSSAVLDLFQLCFPHMFSENKNFLNRNIKKLTKLLSVKLY